MTRLTHGEALSFRRECKSRGATDKLLTKYGLSEKRAALILSGSTYQETQPPKKGGKRFVKDGIVYFVFDGGAVWGKGNNGGYLQFLTMMGTYSII